MYSKKEVLWTELLTNGEVYVIVSTGGNTGDIERINVEPIRNIILLQNES